MKNIMRVKQNDSSIIEFEIEDNSINYIKNKFDIDTIIKDEFKKLSEYRNIYIHPFAQIVNGINIEITVKFNIYISIDRKLKNKEYYFMKIEDNKIIEKSGGFK